MTGLSGMWLVAKRELVVRGRSKSFVISCVLTLLLVVGGLLLPRLIGGEPAIHKVGIVGEGNEPIIEAARALAVAEVRDKEGAKPEQYEVKSIESRAGAETALTSGEVEVVLIDGATILQERAGFTGSGLVERLQAGAGSVRLQRLVEENGQAAQDVIEILSSRPLEVTTLAGEDPGSDVKPFVAYAGLLLMYIAILSYGAWTLTGVTEEKSNRVVEVLLATLRPWQLLGGKVLGIGLLGVFQFALTVAVGYATVRLTNIVDLPAIPISSLFILVLWFVLGFAVYSVSYGAAGSLTSRPEEAQSASLPLTMVAVAGFFISFQVLDDPGSTLARVTSFIPFTAPYVVPIRNSLGGISLAEHAAAVLVEVVAIALLVRLAARIYAGGLLRFSGRTKIREAWRSSDM